MTKSLTTLPQDIDDLFLNGKTLDENNLQEFLKNIGDLLRTRLSRNLEAQQKPTLRMSKLGLPNRKLWYEFNTEIKEDGEKNALKFIYGDIIEQLVMFLAKEAGHLVEEEQQEVVIDGIVGHKDCKIDGVTVDIKSASSFAFRKFALATLWKDDPFGYVAQLSAYMHADKNDKGAFLAVNKENGQMVVLNLDPIDVVHAPTRIAEVREVIASPTPPEQKCYSPEPQGTSGNMILNKNCSYCPFKNVCWKDTNNGMGLRKFRYATGIVNFTEVHNTPRVEEVFDNPTVELEVEE